MFPLINSVSVDAKKSHRIKMAVNTKSLLPSNIGTT